MAVPEQVSVSSCMHSFIKCIEYFFSGERHRGHRDDETDYSIVHEVDMKQVQVTPIVLGYSCLRVLSQIVSPL